MKRRGFIAALGLAPAVASVEPVDLEPAYGVTDVDPVKGVLEIGLDRSAPSRLSGLRAWLLENK